ncbi:MAG: HlyD family efflux transporter periplasmic adaptor subunit [Azospira sp.]|jgi:multidrug efflux pump subunit AcrA (membrane-fusion protein)|nr:HlyD family efflux transporter periplasmic adaptor subunit [Azospira sp.]
MNTAHHACEHSGRCFGECSGHRSSHHFRDHFRAGLRHLTLIACTLAAFAPFVVAHAHEGHDHGDEAPPVTRGDGPQRLADGSVFLPKPTQRQLALRTQLARSSAQPMTVELTGRVVLDPASGGRVQAMNAGRIEAPPGGIPSLGQRVKKGELLARLEPALSPLERGSQAAQAADLRAALSVAERRLARLKELEATVAGKDIDAAGAEVDSLRHRLAAIGGSLDHRETLRAPVSGVVAAANVVAGQVVDARETLFEIVDPDNLRVEALAHEPSLAAEIATAHGRTGSGDSIRLTPLGAGRSLREQAIPLLFRVEGSAPALALNQPLRVIAGTHSRIDGAPLPMAAVVRNAANQEIVWVKSSAEHFLPRTVRTQALDGSRVAIVDGLRDGERVVVQGTALLNQVR